MSPTVTRRDCNWWKAPSYFILVPVQNRPSPGSIQPHYSAFFMWLWPRFIFLLPNKNCQAKRTIGIMVMLLTCLNTVVLP